MYRIAEPLHKTVAEVAEMDLDEFRGWIIWLGMQK